MSNFVVSARKYRPMRFDEVVGQQHISNTLKNAIANNHLAHAFLFCGPRGVGKTTCARILAKVLNCENPTHDHEPCDVCNSCQSFNKNASFNITELDAASNNSVEHIRALIEQVRFQPQKGQFKIFIIDEVHMLSTQAFNAFLKTLEEPPSYAKFILATTEKHKIIPTILSRCQIFDFNRIQVQDIVQHLEGICRTEGIAAEHDALHIIGQKADGALRDALSIFDRIVSFSNTKITYNDVITNLNILDYDYFFKILEAMLSEDVSRVLLTFDEVLRKGFDPSLFVEGLSEHFRNILVSQDEATLKLLESGEALRQRYELQAKTTPTAFLLAALALANDCDVNYKMARNKRLHVELSLIRMSFVQQAMNAAQYAATAVTEKKNTNLTAQPLPKTTVAEEPAPQIVTQTVILKKEKKSLLESLEEEVEIQGKVEEAAPPVVLSLESIRAAWLAYAELPTTTDRMKSLLKTAIVKGLKGHVFEVEVSANLSKGVILEERNLMMHLRQSLQVVDLSMEITVNKSEEEDVPAPNIPQILSPREVYRVMRDRNPMLSELQKRFDLKPE